MNYQWKGDLSGMTLAPSRKGRNPRDIVLHPGRVYDLPRANDHVESLVAQGLLVEVEPELADDATPVSTAASAEPAGDAHEETAK